MSTLSLLVEGSACSWGKLYDSQQMKQIIRSIISFANAHLSMSATNKVLLFVYANGLRKKLVFNSQKHTGSCNDHSLAMVTALRTALKENAESEDFDSSSPLAAVLSHSMCHMKANEDKNEASTSADDKPSSTSPIFTNGRIVIISMTTDFGSEHGSLMNLFFSAAKHGVCADVACMGDASPLLQQAADITNGQFVQIDSPQHLLKYLMISLLPPPTVRSVFPQASLKSVDYRASCACHHELVSTGWVCSVCLSVLCQFAPICRVCKAVFKLPNLPMKKSLKRKAAEK